MTLAKAKLASSITFIVLASFTIVTYDHQNMFIIQATGWITRYSVHLQIKWNMTMWYFTVSTLTTKNDFLYKTIDTWTCLTLFLAPPFPFPFCRFSSSRKRVRRPELDGHCYQPFFSPSPPPPTTNKLERLTVANLCSFPEWGTFQVIPVL
jgi:hypothetical protein